MPARTPMGLLTNSVRDDDVIVIDPPNQPSTSQNSLLTGKSTSYLKVKSVNELQCVPSECITIPDDPLSDSETGGSKTVNSDTSERAESVEDKVSNKSTEREIDGASTVKLNESNRKSSSKSGTAAPVPDKPTETSTIDKNDSSSTTETDDVIELNDTNESDEVNKENKEKSQNKSGKKNTAQKTDDGEKKRQEELSDVVCIPDSPRSDSRLSDQSKCDDKETNKIKFRATRTRKSATSPCNTRKSVSSPNNLRRNTDCNIKDMKTVKVVLERLDLTKLKTQLANGN